MSEKPYPDPPRQTIDDLDPEMATTDWMIETVRSQRVGEEYPTTKTLIINLPIVLRALCDHVLTGQATAFDVAYRLTSIIDTVENATPNPTLPSALPFRHH